jgi:hypothetical protein
MAMHSYRWGNVEETLIATDFGSSLPTNGRPRSSIGRKCKLRSTGRLPSAWAGLSNRSRRSTPHDHTADGQGQGREVSAAARSRQAHRRRRPEHRRRRHQGRAPIGCDEIRAHFARRSDARARGLYHDQDGWATCCGRRSRSLMGPTPTTRWQLASVSLWLRHACKGHRLKLRRKARRNETSDGHIQPDCACEDFLSPLGLGGAVGIGQRMAPTATPEKQFSVAFEAPENVALALRVYQRPQATSVFPYPSR